jgi:hypothetical protein
MIFDAIAAERAGQKEVATLISGAAFQLAHNTIAAAPGASQAHQHDIMTLDDVREAIRNELMSDGAMATTACLHALDCIQKKQYAVAGEHLLHCWSCFSAFLIAFCAARRASGVLR